MEQEKELVVGIEDRTDRSGGRVQTETEETWEPARLMLLAFGGSLRHRLEGEGPSG